MRMTYTQYSLQLHIHINTASHYISHVNVILFFLNKQEKAAQQHARSSLRGEPPGSSDRSPAAGRRLLLEHSMLIPGRHLDLVLMKEVKIHSVKVRKQEMPNDTSAKMDRCV